jgi:succinate-acetate transporter protein
MSVGPPVTLADTLGTNGRQGRWPRVCAGTYTPEMEMKFTKNIGMLLLAIWLILYGVFALFPRLGTFEGEPTVMAILAIVAGVFILIGR